MTEPSRRHFFKTAAGAALTGATLLLPAGSARAVADPRRQDCPGSGLGSTSYSLKVVNKTTNAAVDFAVYQKPVDFNVPDVYSLAWLTASPQSDNTAEFAWNLDYSVSWSGDGELFPGLRYQPDQTLPADPASSDRQQFRLYSDGSAFELVYGQASADPHPGSLYIAGMGDIPPLAASVGVGMSGSGVFAVAAEPDVLVVYTPHPVYWLTAGSFQTGEVLDVERITNAVRLDFGSGTALQATLNADNTWAVAPA